MVWGKESKISPDSVIFPVSAKSTWSIMLMFFRNENMKHFFLRLHSYVTFHKTLVNELNSINSKNNTVESDELIRTTLSEDKNFDNDSSFKILTATINFIKQTQRFEQVLYLLS